MAEKYLIILCVFELNCSVLSGWLFRDVINHVTKQDTHQVINSQQGIRQCDAFPYPDFCITINELRNDMGNA